MQEQAQAVVPQVPRDLIPQVPYQTARQQAGFTGHATIEFIVNGERGIRLSDALEKNFGGLEGRDDRSLFDDSRVQIILRLLVRHMFDVHRRILILPSSLMDVHPGNRR